VASGFDYLAANRAAAAGIRALLKDMVNASDSIAHDMRVTNLLEAFVGAKHDAHYSLGNMRLALTLRPPDPIPAGYMGH
jgi:hypothetical protein